MELCIIGLNHRTTPLEFREQFSVSADRVPMLLERLRADAGLEEAVVLSTCNRLEIYGVSSSGPMSPERVFDCISAVKGNLREFDFQQVLSCLYTHRGEDCIQHLFRVTSSLDSLVLGETEIVGQVKKAYQLAQTCGSTGKILNRLFQKALSVSKEVRTRSGIVAAPDPCALLLRGLETLELRVRRQTESAAELAKRLEAHASVQVVRYPGIGGLLSFDVAGADEARHVETTLRLIRNATSLGGVHSLLEARARWEGDRVPPGLLRLSVGLEPMEDLWADLAQALEFPGDSRARE